MKKLNNNQITLNELATALVEKVNKDEFTSQAIEEARITYTLAEFLGAESREEKIKLLQKFANNVLELYRIAHPEIYDGIQHVYTENDVAVATTNYTEMPKLSKTYVNSWLEMMQTDDSPFDIIADLFGLLKKANTTEENDDEIIELFRYTLDFLHGLMITGVRKDAKKYQLEPLRFIDDYPLSKCYVLSLK